MLPENLQVLLAVLHPVLGGQHDLHFETAAAQLQHLRLLSDHVSPHHPFRRHELSEPDDADVVSML